MESEIEVVFQANYLLSKLKERTFNGAKGREGGGNKSEGP